MNATAIQNKTVREIAGQHADNYRTLHNSSSPGSTITV